MKSIYEPSQRFTERAKLRLRLAAGLIGGTERTLKLNRANFYTEMLKIVKGLAPERRNNIRELVDWLEDYEKAASKAEMNMQPLKKQRRLR